ncbi:MAG: DUF438 domain-containing protein [Bacteroidetes bacterium]|nr:MAG: DUF438 domain-containing protein [Bacteroidota bacterium]
MSELINNSEARKAKLKELILKLHKGESEASVKQELVESLSQIPYGEVVEVEQELISEGLPEEEVLKLCDVHASVLRGHVDLSGTQEVPEGHPVDVMLKENQEVRKVIEEARKLIQVIRMSSPDQFPKDLITLRGLFNSLYDVDKHYLRKEYLLFPFLEQEGITGPPKVMWGKHDEIREQLKGCIEILQTENMTKDEFLATSEIIFKPTLAAVDDMTLKEEEILFPMSLDKLTDQQWLEISQQSLEFGFCLYDPQVTWKPAGMEDTSLQDLQRNAGQIQLPTGNLKLEELLAILNTLPIDMTFVDKDDKVKYFSQAADRIFQRNRAILNRDVRHCHPPASSHIVDKIIEDFKSGKQSRAPFWIQMGGKFVHIEYFALRDEKGEYLGTLEVSNDVARYRGLTGEQRILSYE